MDDTTPQTGGQNNKRYVRFGPHPTDEMPLDWAEKMLANWKERQPNQFGKMLAEVITGPR